MRSIKVRWPFLAALVLTACATVLSTVGGIPPVDEITFSHARHGKAGVECISCHETIFDATTLKGGKFLPEESKCLECHKAEKEKNNCAFCHTDVKLAAKWPGREPKLEFNHVKHLERTKEDCKVCHTALAEPKHPVPVSAGHAACMTCHEHAEQQADAKCSTCHLDLKRYGLKPVAEFTHQGDFVKRHGIAARAEGASCATCHEQNSCLDCHARTAMAAPNVVMPDRPDRSFIHRNDFTSRHAIEARSDPASCKRCHATSSCEQCHTAQNVSPASANPRNPHPPGFAMRGAGVAFHGDLARQNVASCAACHDQGQQSNCVACHKTGGIGGNPHPIGYGNKHTLIDASKNAMCLYCHK